MLTYIYVRLLKNILLGSLKKQLTEFVLKVSKGKNNASTKTFHDFQNVLESMSKRAKNLRILQHLRFVYIYTQVCIPYMLIRCLCNLAYTCNDRNNFCTLFLGSVH